MRYRGESRRARREQSIAADPITTVDPERIAARLEIHRAVCEVIAAMDEPYRSTLVAHYYDGLSLADIARQAGVPEGTVRSRHKQALERVRARLDERSGGNRRAWVAGLAPLVEPRAPAALLGGLVVKKILVAVVLAVIAIIALVSLKAGEPDRAPAVVVAGRGVRISFGATAQPQLPVSGTTSVEAASDKLVRAGARIEGRVLDKTSAPVAKADVWLFDGRRSATRAAISDDEGRFSIAGLNPGRFEVLASSREQVSPARALLLAFGERHDIQLVVGAPRVALTGRVVDEAGRGLASATVEVTGMLSKTERAFTVEGGQTIDLGDVVIDLK
jgi:AcrR family transcriptional regulator